ncbi:MAG: CRISPR-associated endoribonuclease Cas6, partial [Okeania sp. SIO2H7]|nr:CRISPR-associated endoribonuclease Cas6 [Okeania sp. SIO2H7]
MRKTTKKTTTTTKSKSRTSKKRTSRKRPWAAKTELVGIALELVPSEAGYLYPQYTTGLHAWFLDRVRDSDPELSAQLHDDQIEKAFTISNLEGELSPAGKGFEVHPDRTYRWYITAISSLVASWLADWIEDLPPELSLHGAPLEIRSWEVFLRATTYDELFAEVPPTKNNVKLTFITPTSFRQKKNHLPLPVPRNLFHSYLRRWNVFSGIEFPQEEFLEWVEENVLISHHKIESSKVAAGKKGMVTGFTGSVELNLSRYADENEDFYRLFYALVELAPYVGTGHKTTFGLGQTRIGWLEKAIAPTLPMNEMLAARIDELTEIFLAQKKRSDNKRSRESAQTWATILARREWGESVSAIADDLEMRY